MRIIVCMTHYCPWSNPTAQTLQSLGHEVHVFDFDTVQGGFIDPNNAGVAADFEEHKKLVSGFHLIHPVDKGHIRYLFAARRLRALARKLNADCILSLYGGGYALMTYLSGIRPFAVYVVGSDVLLAGGFARRINKIVLTAAAQVFANGEYLAEKAREQAPKARIMPLLIGVNLDSLRMSGFDERPVRMICTRGFLDVYNNESIIEAIARFPEDAPDFRMVFVSGGKSLPKNIELADRILPPQLRPKVEFWGGVAYETLLEGLRGSHVFMSMSRSDGTATSTLEAMGSGLFPILSDIPQNRALIKPGDPNGALVGLDDPDALAQAMLGVLRAPDVCARHAQTNRRLVEDKADAARNRATMAGSIEEAVERSRRNGR